MTIERLGLTPIHTELPWTRLYGEPDSPAKVAGLVSHWLD